VKARPAGIAGGNSVLVREGGSDKEDSAKLADDINADFVTFGTNDAAVGVLSDAPPICLRNTRKRIARHRLPIRKKSSAAAAN
jgi:hypothetical protein